MKQQHLDISHQTGKEWEGVSQLLQKELQSRQIEAKAQQANSQEFLSETKWCLGLIIFLWLVGVGLIVVSVFISTQQTSNNLNATPASQKILSQQRILTNYFSEATTFMNQILNLKPCSTCVPLITTINSQTPGIASISQSYSSQDETLFVQRVASTLFLGKKLLSSQLFTQINYYYKALSIQYPYSNSITSVNNIYSKMEASFSENQNIYIVNAGSNQIICGYLYIINFNGITCVTYSTSLMFKTLSVLPNYQIVSFENNAHTMLQQVSTDSTFFTGPYQNGQTIVQTNINGQIVQQIQIIKSLYIIYSNFTTFVNPYSTPVKNNLNNFHSSFIIFMGSWVGAGLLFFLYMMGYFSRTLLADIDQIINKLDTGQRNETLIWNFEDQREFFIILRNYKLQMDYTNPLTYKCSVGEQLIIYHKAYLFFTDNKYKGIISNNIGQLYLIENRISDAIEWFRNSIRYIEQELTDVLEDSRIDNYYLFDSSKRKGRKIVNTKMKAKLDVIYSNRCYELAIALMIENAFYNQAEIINNLNKVIFIDNNKTLTSRHIQAQLKLSEINNLLHNSPNALLNLDIAMSYLEEYELNYQKQEHPDVVQQQILLQKGLLFRQLSLNAKSGRSFTEALISTNKISKKVSQQTLEELMKLPKIKNIERLTLLKQIVQEYKAKEMMIFIDWSVATDQLTVDIINNVVELVQTSFDEQDLLSLTLLGTACEQVIHKIDCKKIEYVINNIKKLIHSQKYKNICWVDALNQLLFQYKVQNTYLMLILQNDKDNSIHNIDEILRFNIIMLCQPQDSLLRKQVDRIIKRNTNTLLYDCQNAQDLQKSFENIHQIIYEHPLNESFPPEEFN